MSSVQIEQKSYEMPPREGISIAHRIRKRQFKFGPGRWICWSLKKQWDKALA